MRVPYLPIKMGLRMCPSAIWFKWLNLITSLRALQKPKKNQVSMLQASLRKSLSSNKSRSSHQSQSNLRVSSTSRMSSLTATKKKWVTLRAWETPLYCWTIITQMKVVSHISTWWIDRYTNCKTTTTTSNALMFSSKVSLQRSLIIAMRSLERLSSEFLKTILESSIDQMSKDRLPRSKSGKTSSSLTWKASYMGVCQWLSRRGKNQ